MHLQQYNVFYLRFGSTSIGHARHVKSRNDNGFDIFTKIAVFCGKKMFQKQIQEVQYTIHIRHIANISDFLWFKRSCGSMKSVSSFRSIETTQLFFIAIYLFSINPAKGRKSNLMSNMMKQADTLKHGLDLASQVGNIRMFKAWLLHVYKAAPRKNLSSFSYSN